MCLCQIKNSSLCVYDASFCLHYDAGEHCASERASEKSVTLLRLTIKMRRKTFLIKMVQLVCAAGEFLVNAILLGCGTVVGSNKHKKKVFSSLHQPNQKKKRDKNKERKFTKFLFGFDSFGLYDVRP